MPGATQVASGLKLLSHQFWEIGKVKPAAKTQLANAKPTKASDFSRKPAQQPTRQYEREPAPAGAKPRTERAPSRRAG